MSGLLSRHIFESPLPTAILLLLAAGAMAWAAFARDDRRLLGWAALPASAAAAALLLGALVTTPGEHGEAAIRRLVAAAERGDIDGLGGMLSMLAPDATLHIAREEAPAIPIEGLAASFRTLGGRHRIAENTITSLEGETLDGDRARVELACRTVTNSSMGSPVATRWAFEVRRDARDPSRWLVKRVAFLTVAGRAADGSILR